MKEIQLTQGKVALVDDEDFEELSRYKWYAMKVKKLWYAARGDHNFYMHHQILGKPPQGLVTDHIDDNGLNNQKENLRFITQRENCQYPRTGNKSSPHPGVNWHKQRRKWRARIWVNSRERYLGLFNSEGEAAQAYQDALEEIENPPLDMTIEESIYYVKKVKEKELILKELEQCH